MTFDERITKLERLTKRLQNEICCNGGIGAAINGLTSGGTGIVLGQDVGAVGDPAALLSNREIPMGTFSLTLTDDADGTSTQMLAGDDLFTQTNIFGSGVDVTNEVTALGMDINTSNSSKAFSIQVTNNIASFAMHDNTNNEHLTYGQANLSITGDSVASSAPNINLTDDALGGTGTITMLAGDFQFNSDFSATMKAPSGIFMNAVNGGGESSIPVVTIGTGLTVTGSNTKVGLLVTGTWNTSGAPAMIRANVTNTASGAAAKLIDLQVANATKFAVGKTGTVTLDASLIVAAPSTTAAGTVTNRYGGATNFLGDPVAWGTLTIGVTAYKVPLYT